LKCPHHGAFLIVKHEANISMNPKQSTPKKFLNIFGKYLIFMNIQIKEEEGYYVYSFRVGG
jgi:hypothetical protein